MAFMRWAGSDFRLCQARSFPLFLFTLVDNLLLMGSICANLIDYDLDGVALALKAGTSGVKGCALKVFYFDATYRPIFIPHCNIITT